MAAMNENLTEKLKRLASDLRALDKQLQTEPAPDLSTLYEFRQVLDGVRLSAWSISELIHARTVAKTSDTVFTFLVTQRLHRFEQMVTNLCLDLDRQALAGQEAILQPASNALYALQQRLEKRNIFPSKQ